MTKSTSTRQAEEQVLRNAGWKIHSKEGLSKFWESPYDGKVYSTSMAIIAQRIHEDEERSKVRAKQLLGEDKAMHDFEEYFNWTKDLDKIISPPKKKVKKSKAKKQAKEVSIKELGF